MTPAKELTRDDIMDMAAYGAIRMERRREIVADKTGSMARARDFRELLDHVAAGP